jgi:hypothetical protein
MLSGRDPRIGFQVSFHPGEVFPSHSSRGEERELGKGKA